MVNQNLIRMDVVIINQITDVEYVWRSKDWWVVYNGDTWNCIVHVASSHLRWNWCRNTMDQINHIVVVQITHNDNVYTTNVL